MRTPRVPGVVLALACSLACAGQADAQLIGPDLPANDLNETLALLGGQAVATGPATMAPAPPLAPVPRAACGPGSAPLDDPIQGRVPRSALETPQAARGWTCNTAPIARHPVPGGFRVWRHSDRNGHTCAFYDSSLPSPANVLSLSTGPTQGVVVLDMTDPATPVETDRLVTPGMIKPHESLNLHAGRGLLVAQTGTAGTAPGTIDVYDVADDCRKPRLLSLTPNALGHESGFSPDGRTYWVAGGTGLVVAVDLTDPANPYVVWRGNLNSHGISLSPDGRTLFQTDTISGQLGVHDVSEVQDRRPDPQVRQLSRITWSMVSIPQGTLPVTFGGRPHVIEFDEFAFRFNPATIDDRVGAARIIDVQDPRAPEIVSDLRLEVNMQDVHRQVSGDPTSLPGNGLTYSAHYCAVPTTVDPEIVACSFTNSGLRVFDIRDPKHPRESAYFVSPPKQDAAPGVEANFAMSQPAFDAERRQLWYSDATSGLYVLQLDERAWPKHVATEPARACGSRRVITIRLPRGLRTATVRYAGRRAAVVRRGGRLTARIDLRGRRAGRVTVRVRGRTPGGRSVTQTRRFRTCA